MTEEFWCSVQLFDFCGLLPTSYEGQGQCRQDLSRPVRCGGRHELGEPVSLQGPRGSTAFSKLFRIVRPPAETRRWLVSWV